LANSLSKEGEAVINSIMKYLIALTILAGGLHLRAAAEETNSTARTDAPIKITAAEAKKHVGENAVVSGTIAEVNKAERLIRLNFEKPYPDNPFTAVIFARATNQFPEVEKLKGKTAEVSGKVAEYNGHPQIVLNSTNQLKVIEKEAK